MASERMDDVKIEIIVHLTLGRKPTETDEDFLEYVMNEGYYENVNDGEIMSVSFL